MGEGLFSFLFSSNMVVFKIGRSELDLKAPELREIERERGSDLLAVNLFLFH